MSPPGPLASGGRRDDAQQLRVVAGRIVPLLAGKASRATTAHTYTELADVREHLRTVNHRS